MALAFVSAAVATQVGGGSTSLTWAIDCTGADILWVGLNGGATPSGVTYNGVAMTSTGDAFVSGHCGNFSLWFIIAPTTGSNNVVASFSSADMAGIAASYSGSKQTGQPDAHNKDSSDPSGTTYSEALTTVADNSWVVWLAGNNQGTPNIAAGASTTRRGLNNGGVTSRSCALLDTNAAVTPAGSRTLNASGSSGFWAGIIGSTAPAVATTNTKPNMLLVF